MFSATKFVVACYSGSSKATQSASEIYIHSFFVPVGLRVPQVLGLNEEKGFSCGARRKNSRFLCIIK